MWLITKRYFGDKESFATGQSERNPKGQSEAVQASLK